MRILIIGGTGLISTAITRQLLERGFDVTLFNRGKTPSRVSEGAKFLYGDRRDYPTFVQQMREAGTFDCVIEMIGYVREDAESLVQAFAGRTAQVVFCSTVDVYQRPASRYPYREDEPLRGLSDYARNKIVCEQVLREAHERGDFALTILRPAHTYGEGGSLLHSFGWSTTYIDRLRKGKPIVVHGDGQSLWVSCHVDDVARAFVHAIGNPRALGRAYHVTGEEWMTWNQYHQKVAQAIGAPEPTLVHIPTDLLVRLAPERAGICAVNLQFNNVFDNGAARADLGFRYTIPFVEGVRRTVAWLDSQGAIATSDEDVLEDRVIQVWRKLSEEVVREVGEV